MDNKKTEAGECTEENGNSSVEREESSSRSISVSGNKNFVVNNCNFNYINIPENKELTPSPSLGQTGSSKAGTAVKQPEKRAPLRKEDEAPPKKKKGAGSDKPLSDKGRKMLEETLPDKELTPSPSLGQAGSSKAGTDGQCSNLSTVFENVGKTSKLIRVMIYDEEVKSSYKKDAKKWLPGKFRVMDPSGWSYLIVFDKANGKIFKQGQIIEVSNVKAINKEELTCNARSVKSSSEPVQIPDCIVDKMKQEETFTSLEEIREGEPFKKTKVIICKVGEQMSRGNLFFRELKVKASRTAQDIETLVAFNLPAKFKYKAAQEVKIPCVKYNDVKNQFQTSGDCVVKKLSDI